MQELGPCAEIVQNTTMKCFFILEAGVRQALSEDGLTSTVNKALGQDAASCYETGLISLGKCLT